jgi:hypothetical protein
MTPDALVTVPFEALSAVVGGAPACDPNRPFNQKDRAAVIRERRAAGMSRDQADLKTPTVRQANNRCALDLNPWDTSQDPHVPAERDL